jgi:cytochrome c
LAACGNGEREEPEAKSESAVSGLSAFELENGIGPVKEKLELGALDQALADSGRKVFEVKCSMCHKMDTTYVGPSLGEVTTRRTPAFIMNMILNPQEMVERHPVAKQLLAERMTFMANQGLSVPEARAVLEYLRTQSRSSKPASKETTP